MHATHLTYHTLVHLVLFCFLWRCGPKRAMSSSFLRFLNHTQRRTTVGRTPLDEWSAHRRDLYLATHNTHNRQTSTPPVGFESTISAGERPQTYALDRAATGAGRPSGSPSKCSVQAKSWSSSKLPKSPVFCYTQSAKTKHARPKCFWFIACRKVRSVKTQTL